MSYELLVLAAGVGSRYGGAKQLERVGPAGETLMDYALWDAAAAGVRRAVFVIRREHERIFRQEITRRYLSRLEVDFAFQELSDLPAGFGVPPDRQKPWGTGHAVWAARHLLRGPFATINADDYYGASGFLKLSEFFSSERSPNRYALVAYELGKTLSPHGSVSRGVCTVDAGGRLLAVEEVTGIEPLPNEAPRARAGDRVFSGREPVSMNLWGLGPSIFPLLGRALEAFLGAGDPGDRGELYLPTVIDREVTSGAAEVAVLPVADSWLGVTYREDREAVMRELARRAAEYPSPLWS
jgi:NDP-sugar pyrophosphorylase family protein